MGGFPTGTRKAQHTFSEYQAQAQGHLEKHLFKISQGPISCLTSRESEEPEECTGQG